MKNKVYLTQEGKEEIESEIEKHDDNFNQIAYGRFKVLTEILENSEVINPKPTLKELCSKDEDLRNEVIEFVYNVYEESLITRKNFEISARKLIKQNI